MEVEEHHGSRAHTEGDAFAGADFEGGCCSPVAFDQQAEERESEGFLNTQVEKEKALLALRNGFVDLRAQIQAARKCFMEG